MKILMAWSTPNGSKKVNILKLSFVSWTLIN